MRKEILRVFNGNGQLMKKELPTLIILGKMNDVALAHMKKNTGLNFKDTSFGYTVQPKTSNQLARLFLTYNFKTRYFNNADYKNTLFLKHGHSEDWNK